MGDTVVQVSDKSFEADVLKSDLPVLVDFWAPWCGPCKLVAPAVEEIAADYAGRLKVAKMNVDENPMQAQKYGVRSIPALILFRDGDIVDQKIGAVSKAALALFVDERLQS